MFYIIILVQKPFKLKYTNLISILFVSLKIAMYIKISQTIHKIKRNTTIELTSCNIC